MYNRLLYIIFGFAQEDKFNYPQFDYPRFNQISKNLILLQK